MTEMVVTCPNQHSIEVSDDQFGQRIICPLCQILMFVTPLRPDGGGGVKYEIRCPAGHALRVKKHYLGQIIPCPSCLESFYVNPQDLSYHSPTVEHHGIEEEPISVIESKSHPANVEEAKIINAEQRRQKQVKAQRRQRPGMRSVYEGLDLIYSHWVLDVILGRLLTLIGYYRCLRVPVETGGRVWINLAFWPIIVGILVGILVVLPMGLTVNPENEASVMLIVGLFAACCIPQLTAPYLFLFFLSKIADYLGKRKLRAQIMQLMPWGVWGIISTILYIIGITSFLIGYHSQDKGTAVVFLLIFCITVLLAMILGFIYFFLTLARTGDVRHAVENFLER